MKLIEALKLENPILITLIGGGGKTTTLFRLGEELALQKQSVVLTTTTAMFMPHKSTYDVSIITKSVDKAKKAIKENRNAKRILLGREITSENKLKGFSPNEMDEIYKENKERWFLVEGDGSNGRSLKIPDTHEPQVPSLSSITIILIGSDVLGNEINSENVHRDHLIHKLIPKCGRYVDKDLLLNLIFHPLGITKGIPSSSKNIILFNKVKSSENLEEISNLSKDISIENEKNIKSKRCYTHINSNEDFLSFVNISYILLGEVQDEDPILEVINVKTQ